MRLMVVDDHEVVRRGVRALLSEQTGWEVCGEAVDGQDAVEKARDLNPDLIVMDVSMPRLNGLEATRQIRNLLPGCEVLVLSQHENNEMARQALKAGARGYVVKSSISRDLIAAIEKVSRGDYFFDTAILNQTSPAHTDVQEILQRSAAFQRALQKSEQLYRSTFELAAVGVAHVSPDGRWLRVNRKLCQIVGYTEQELLGLTFQQITHPDDLPSDLAQTEKLLKGALEMFSMEKRYIRKDGSHVWINLTVSCMRDDDGKPEHFISIVEDIDARKRAQNALRESEERLQLAQQVANVGTFDWNIKTGVNRWTPELERLYGLLPGSFPGTHLAWKALLHPEDRERVLRNVERALKNEDSWFEGRWRVTWDDGSVHWLLGRAWVVRDHSGAPERMIGVNVDITPQKRVEDALEDSGKQLALALESSKSAMFDWDVPRNRGKWNAQMQALYGFQPEGEYITAEEWRGLFHPDDVNRLADEAAQFWAKGEEFNFEFRTAPQNGEFKWMTSHGRIVRDEHGKPVRMIGIHTDITDRKRAQEQLQESESRLRAAFSQTYSFLGLLKPDGTIIDVNRAALELAGISDPSQALGRKFWDAPWWSPLPDEVALLKQTIAEVAAGQAVRSECFFCLANGTRRVADRTLSPVFDARGQVVMIVATGVDITERKETEERLAKEARALSRLNACTSQLWKIRTLQDGLNEMLSATIELLGADKGNVQILDADRGVLTIAAQRGFEKEFLDFFREVAAEDDTACGRALRSGERIVIEDVEQDPPYAPFVEIARAAGYRAVLSIPLIAKEGAPLGILSTHFRRPHRPTEQELARLDLYVRQAADFIERCRTDENLRKHGETTGLLAAIVTSSDDAIVSKNLDGIIQSWNTGAERIFGYTAKEAIGQHIKLIIPPDRYPEEDDILARLRRGERIDHFQTIRQRKDGTLIDVSVTISPIRDSQGRVTGASKVARDITAQKRADQQLRESEQRYKMVTDASPLMVWMSGTDKLCFYFNKGWLDFVGRTLEQESGNGWAENVHPDDFERCLQIYVSNFDARRPFEMEYRLRHRTGQYRWILDCGTPRYAPDGTFEGYIGGCLDIHDRKEAAEKIRVADETLRLLKTQDEERRRIARDLHDSAGQTLTVLSLKLAQLVQDAETISPEIANEGKRIEEIVQQLHREIRTTSYLLHPPLLDEAGLNSALSWYVQGLMERSTMTIELSIPDDFGRLPAEIELAIFRVVQECLTNIHRHAESKTAFIRIARENSRVCIEVRDEGKGIPPDRLAELQLRSSGVGIRGMQERLRQFAGQLTIESDSSGTRVLATIPIPQDFLSTEQQPLQTAV